MNRIDILHGQAGNGRQTMMHFQNAIQDAFAMLLTNFTATTPAFKIDGCTVAENTVGGDVTVATTAGVLALNGEVFRVAAHSIQRDVTEYAWFAPYEQYVDVTPALNAEGVAMGNQVRRTMILMKGSNYPAAGQYVPLHALTQIQLLQNKLAARLGRVGDMKVIDIADIPLSNFDSTGMGLAATNAEGYAICNGNNGTVDMRGLTVVGATQVPNTGAPSLPAGVEATYHPGDVFGAEKHALSVEEMPEHTHEYIPTTPYGSALGGGDLPDVPATAAITNTGPAGGGLPHENRQPGVALVWVKVVA